MVHSPRLEDPMTELPRWTEPGASATLIWYDAVDVRPDGVRVYQVSGPVLDAAPPSPYFVLAPLQQSGFADRLYRGEVTLPELRSFLEHCSFAHGALGDGLDVVFTRAEVGVLTLLDAWTTSADRPLVPYSPELDAFLWDDAPPIFVSPEAYREAQQSSERFRIASVCAGCGEPDDASVFFWTRRGAGRVRVCFLIQNEGGCWTCRLHPFEFESTDALSPAAERAD